MCGDDAADDASEVWASGRGLPPDAPREHGGRAGAAAQRDEELAELAFAPGVSTARDVSQLAGRGVGMDLMRAG